MAVSSPRLCRHSGRVLCSAPGIPATAKTFTHTRINKYCLAGSTAPVLGSGLPCFCPLKEHGAGGRSSAVQALGTGEDWCATREKKDENQAQLNKQRSRLLSCRLTLRRLCSRPRSRRSSSSRALRTRGSSQSQSWPYLQALRFQTWHPRSAPRGLSNSRNLPGPRLTCAPSDPGPGPARPSDSLVTPAPPAGVVLGAAARQFSATLRDQEPASGGCPPWPCSYLQPPPSHFPPSMASMARSSRLSSSNLRSKSCSSMLMGRGHVRQWDGQAQGCDHFISTSFHGSGLGEPQGSAHSESVPAALGHTLDLCCSFPASHFYTHDTPKGYLDEKAS